MELGGNKCHACAIEEESQIMELRLETASRQSILGNIYVGQVENIASNIQAAFVLIAPGVRGYFPLQEAEQVIYASGKAPGSPLRPGARESGTSASIRGDCGQNTLTSNLGGVNNHVAVRRVARRFVLSDFGKRNDVAGSQILLNQLEVAACANDIGDLVVFRTYRRANGIGISEADTLGRTAHHRFSVNLRVAAAVACEVNIFAVGS